MISCCYQSNYLLTKKRKYLQKHLLKLLISENLEENKENLEKNKEKLNMERTGKYYYQSRFKHYPYNEETHQGAQRQTKSIQYHWIIKRKKQKGRLSNIIQNIN